MENEQVFLLLLLPVACTLWLAEGLDDGEIRLVGNCTSAVGRVEVYHDGEWGTINGQSWGVTDANVACKQLGYPSAVRAIRQHGGGTGRVWLSQVACSGDKMSIWSCAATLILGHHMFSHSEDAGVECSPPVRPVLTCITEAPSITSTATASATVSLSVAASNKAVTLTLWQLIVAVVGAFVFGAVFILVIVCVKERVKYRTSKTEPTNPSRVATTSESTNPIYADADSAGAPNLTASRAYGVGLQSLPASDAQNYIDPLY